MGSSKKQMKRKDVEKGFMLFIAILVIIFVVVIVINLTKKDEESTNNESNNSGESLEVEDVKTLLNVDITDIDITNEDGMFVIQAVLSNDTEEDIDLENININIINSNNEIAKTVSVYVGSIPAKSTRQLDYTAQLEISDCIDVTFTK